MAREYFQAYHSYREALGPLTDAERGRLFTALLAYSATGEEPRLPGNERFVFPSMRQQIDRDARRYEEKCAVNRRNARQRTANGSERLPSPAFAAKEKEKEKTKEKAKEKEKLLSGKPDLRAGEIAAVVAYLNRKLGTHYRPGTVATAAQIRQRLDEGLTVADLQRAVDNKCADWDHEPEPGRKDMRPYLRPETLFGPKCESYANEVRGPGRDTGRQITGPRRAPKLPADGERPAGGSLTRSAGEKGPGG